MHLVAKNAVIDLPVERASPGIQRDVIRSREARVARSIDAVVPVAQEVPHEGLATGSLTVRLEYERSAGRVEARAGAAIGARRSDDLIRVSSHDHRSVGAGAQDDMPPVSQEERLIDIRGNPLNDGARGSGPHALRQGEEALAARPGRGGVSIG